MLFEISKKAANPWKLKTNLNTYTQFKDKCRLDRPKKHLDIKSILFWKHKNILRSRKNPASGLEKAIFENNSDGLEVAKDFNFP